MSTTNVILNLMLAIQTRLRSYGLLKNIVRHESIFITHDEDYVPNYTLYPAIGILLSTSNEDFYPNKNYFQNVLINIIAYQELLTNYNQDALLHPSEGLYRITEYCKQALIANRLNLSSCIDAFCISEDEESSFGTELLSATSQEDTLTRQVITLEYTLQRKWV